MSKHDWPVDLTPDERRRLEVLEWCLRDAEENGYANLSAAARRFGVSRASVGNWVDRYEAEGWEGLRTRKRRSTPPGLSDSDLKRLAKILEKGALKAGYRDDLWSLPRVAEVIKAEFGFEYHPAHVSKILRHRMGFSSQRPQRVPREKDQKKADTWLREEWPRIKGGPKRRERPSFSLTRADSP